ncbi:MAG: DUF1543 domain-containing protein [Holosporaceae bacterium]
MPTAFNTLHQQKLYMIYIGGYTKGALIELHDMRFVVAKNIEDTFASLRQQWWGEPDRLHLDAWGVVHSADGYQISLHDTPQQEELKLFFVNLGGYDPKVFSELHHNVLVVAPSAPKAKVKALKGILNWSTPHRDALFEVENIFCVNQAAQEQNLHIHLTPTENPKPFRFICKYRKVPPVAA